MGSRSVVARARARAHTHTHTCSGRSDQEDDKHTHTLTHIHTHTHTHTPAVVAAIRKMRLFVVDFVLLCIARSYTAFLTRKKGSLLSFYFSIHITFL